MKKIVIILIGILVLATGVYALSTSENSNEPSNQLQSETETIKSDAEANDTAPEANIEEAPATGLGYIEFSEQALSDASNSTRIVFFHAPWCSTCNFFEGEIEEEGVPSDVTILKVDFDTQTELKEKYGVTIQSTFVLLDSEGNVEKTWPFARGLTSINDLYSQV